MRMAMPVVPPMAVAGRGLCRCAVSQSADQEEVQSDYLESDDHPRSGAKSRSLGPAIA